MFQLYEQGLINAPQFTLSLGDLSYIKFGAEETNEDDTNIKELTIPLSANSTTVTDWSLETLAGFYGSSTLFDSKTTAVLNSGVSMIMMPDAAFDKF